MIDQKRVFVLAATRFVVRRPSDLAIPRRRRDVRRRSQMPARQVASPAGRFADDAGHGEYARHADVAARSDPRSKASASSGHRRLEPSPTPLPLLIRQRHRPKRIRPHPVRPQGAPDRDALPNLISRPSRAIQTLGAQDIQHGPTTHSSAVKFMGRNLPRVPPYAVGPVDLVRGDFQQRCEIGVHDANNIESQAICRCQERTFTNVCNKLNKNWGRMFWGSDVARSNYEATARLVFEPRPPFWPQSKGRGECHCPPTGAAARGGEEGRRHPPASHTLPEHVHSGAVSC